MKVKLPAEEQDRLMRPAYITDNESGTPLCENRYVKSLFKFSIPLACGVTSMIKLVVRTCMLGRPWCCCGSNEADSPADQNYLHFFLPILQPRLSVTLMGPDYHSIESLQKLDMLRSLAWWFDNADCPISRGVPRLKYLVTKGAVMRKGQMFKATFSKYSHTLQGILPSI